MAALKDFQSLCSMQEFPLLGQCGLKILHRTSGVPRGKSSMQKILQQLRTFFFFLEHELSPKGSLSSETNQASQM